MCVIVNNQYIYVFLKMFIVVISKHILRMLT